MANLDFPASPVNGQTYVVGDVTWTYNSTYGVWNITSAGPGGGSLSGTATGNIDMNGFSISNTLINAYRENILTANVTGSYTLNLLNSNTFRLNLSGNTTLSLNNAPANTAVSPITLIINRTAANAIVTFPANTVWSESIQPVQSTGIGQRDIFTLLVIDSGALIVGAHSFANIG